MWLFVMLLIFVVLAFFLPQKDSTPSDSPINSNTNEFLVPLNSEDYEKYIDSVLVGDNINLWASKYERNEVRVYCMGQYSGKGLLSVFTNKKLHSFLVDMDKEDMSVEGKVIEKRDNGLTLEILKMSNESYSTNLPKQIKIPLNSTGYKDYIDEVEIGDELRLWYSYNYRGEIRAYCRPYVGGEGLLSVFKNLPLYDFDVEQRELREYYLDNEVVDKGRNYVTIKLIKVVNTYTPPTEEELFDNFISPLQEKITGKWRLVRLEFYTTKRLTNKQFTKDLKLCVNLPREKFIETATKIYHSEKNEELEEWQNTLVWLEYKGEKISIRVENIIRLIHYHYNGFSYFTSLTVDNDKNQLSINRSSEWGNNNSEDKYFRPYIANIKVRANKVG